MDGNTSMTYDCTVFGGKGHIMQFDSGLSGPDKTVYSCPCGALVIEPEDAGTGA